MKYCIFIFVTILLIFPTRAFDTIDKNEVRTITIREDGTYTEDKTVDVEVLTEEGRNKLRLLEFPFSSSKEKVTYIKVTVVNEDGTETLYKDNFTELPNMKISGFTDAKTFKAILPNLKIGSIVKIHVTREYFKNLFAGKNHFTYYFGLSRPEINSKLIVKSARPLKIRLNDLDDNFELKKTNDSYFTLLQKKRIDPPLFDEPYTAFNPLQWNFVTFSTAESFADLYEEVIQKNSEVQDSFKIHDFLTNVEIEHLQGIFRRDREKGITELLNILNIKFSYSGDYRSADNHYFLENIHENLKKKSGDCKFFSHLALKALRELGFRGELVIGELSGNPDILVNSFPFPESFNHMLLRIWVQENPIYIDPTNSRSIAPDFIGDSLRYRFVMPLVEGSKLSWIGEPLKKTFELTNKITYKTVGNSIIENEEVILRGNSKYAFDKALEKSKAKDRYLSDFLGIDGNVTHTNGLEISSLSGKADEFPMEQFTTKKPFRIKFIDELVNGKKRVRDMVIKDRMATIFTIKAPKNLGLVGAYTECNIKNKYFELKVEKSFFKGISTFTQTYYPKAFAIPVDDANILKKQLEGTKGCFVWKQGILVLKKSGTDLSINKDDQMK